MTRQSADPARQRDRQAVRTVECPRCGAAPHQKCIGSRGQPRYASHQERWDAYRAVSADVPTVQDLAAALALAQPHINTDYSNEEGACASDAVDAILDRARRAGLL